MKCRKSPNLHRSVIVRIDTVPSSERSPLMPMSAEERRGGERENETVSIEPIDPVTAIAAQEGIGLS